MMDLSWLGVSLGSEFLLSLCQIMWINVLLSGDNAVVIALACRGLPPAKRRVGITLGALAAIALRIVFTLLVNSLLMFPYLKLAGGALLLWIAVKLLTQEEANEDSVAANAGLWQAVRTVAVADIVMSLDNVLAIAAAAKGDSSLIVIGLAVSVPLIIGGATLLAVVLHRFPILVWAGAALLGWIAGDLIASDPAAGPILHDALHALNLPATLEFKIDLGKWLPLIGSIGPSGPTAEILLAVCGALLVLLFGMLLRGRTDPTHAPPA
jgi:YjbE family integral membrane protein